MKKLIAAVAIILCSACVFTACSSGKIGKEAEDLNTVVTEDPTKLRTIYGNTEGAASHFIYEVINPYEKGLDGADRIDGSYEIYSDQTVLGDALKEKALVTVNSNGFIEVAKFTDLTGGEWVCYVNGTRTKRDIAKINIEDGATYSFKYIVKD